MTTTPTPAQNVVETTRGADGPAGAARRTGCHPVPAVFRSGALFRARRPAPDDLTAIHRNAAEFLKPARRTGTAALTTLASLIDWSNRFKGPNSVLFADLDRTKPSITCIADYHLSGPATISDDGDPTARHLQHRGVYEFPVAPGVAGLDRDPEPRAGKDEFGAFIEDNLKDILDPTPYLLGGKGEPEDWERRLRQIAIQLGGRFGQVPDLVQLSKSLQIHDPAISP